MLELLIKISIDISIHFLTIKLSLQILKTNFLKSSHNLLATRSHAWLKFQTVQNKLL